MERKGLGKGLGALIPGAENETRSSTAEVEVARIAVNPYQPRNVFDDDKLHELVESIRVHGVLQPVVVRSKGGGEYELVAGERRLRAAKAAGLTRIPAVVRELTNAQSIEVALVENLQREDIGALDAAVSYKRLADEFGLTQEDIAFELGKSRSAVANTMRLLGLPESVKDALRAGRISEGHARAILSIEGEDAQSEICGRIVSGGLSVRESERLAKSWGKAGGGAKKKASVPRETLALDPNLQQIESELRLILGTKVDIIKTKDRGRIEVEFYSDDDLQRIVELLSGA